MLSACIPLAWFSPPQARKGDTILCLGDTPQFLAMVVAGTAKLTFSDSANPGVPGDAELAGSGVEKGDLVGHDGLFFRLPRTVGAVATSDMQLLALHYEDVIRINEAAPGAFALALQN